MFGNLRLGVKTSFAVSLTLLIGFAGGLLFIYSTERQQLDDTIHDKARRILLAIEATHTQAMIHRGHKNDNNPVIETLNGTLEYLSKTQDRMNIWLIMGPKVIDFQLKAESNEVEPPIDDVDRDAMEAGKPVGRYVSDTLYRYTVPVILGEGSGSYAACFTCHGKDMGIQPGEPIGGYSVAYDAKDDVHEFWVLFSKTSAYFAALVIFISGFIVYIINIWATKPIAEISNTMRRIADTDDEVPIPASDTAKSAEISDILESLRIFNNSSQSKLKSLRDAIVQAEKANRTKSEFLSTMSHELRTPLTSSIGSLGLLKSVSFGDLSIEGNDLVEIALRNNQSLLRLVNELLDYEKVVSGTLEIEIRRHNICDLTSDIVKNNQDFAQSQSINFGFRNHATPLYANVHEHRFEQVLNNLLSNAAKFSESGSHVEIFLECANENVFVRVKDFGCGIPEEFRPKIFDQFTQADSSSTRKYGGTGLGLSISRSLIEAMGGTLEFETEVNVGSTFSIVLPSSI